MKGACILFIVVVCSQLASARTGAPQASSQERVTVMVYMNAQNSLDCFAVANVRQMVSALPLKDMSVVIELGRSRTANNCDQEDPANRWDGTLFFRIHRTLILRPRDSLLDVPEKPSEPGKGANVDMGDPKALRRFVLWAEKRYPATHYVLIMWGHSRGLRFMQDSTNGYRVVSIDDPHHSSMFTHDFLAALGGTRKLDVLAFDSCLMAGIETAYVLSGLASAMVGSEELESNDGWNYTRILKAISHSSDRSAKRLGAAIVNAQRDCAAKDGPVTLSAVDLKKIPQVANRISQLADALSAGLQDKRIGTTVRSTIDGIRSNCQNYGQMDGFNNPIDLLNVVTQLRDKAPTPEIKKAAEHLLTSFKEDNVVVANYATAEMKREFGSNGLTIYFPPDKGSYNHDPDDHGEAYSTCICDQPEKHPVDFVCKANWSSFLHVYFQQENGQSAADAVAQPHFE